MLQFLILSAALVVALPSARSEDDRVIDLQELLLNVSDSYRDFSHDIKVLGSNLASNVKLIVEERFQKIQDVLDQKNSDILTGFEKCRPRDCADVVQDAQGKTNGIYRVYPEGLGSCGIQVFCDLEKDGGGWTIIQRRGNFGKPQDYFFKRWRDYKFGFGNIAQDFWLGNDNIYHLTNQNNYELRVDLTANDGETKFAQYSEFFIGNEASNYKLNIYGFSGDAGDSFTRHDGYGFTTIDRDNDGYSENCAALYKGGWWYDNCHASNLNGLYLNGSHESYADGVNWYSWKGYHFSLRDVVMKIRPK